jgi:hypothetical protein
VSDNLIVDSSEVTVEIVLPQLAIAFQKQIAAGIRNELTTLLA